MMNPTTSATTAATTIPMRAREDMRHNLCNGAADRRSPSRNDRGAGQMARPSRRPLRLRRWRASDDQHLPALASTVSFAPFSAVNVTPILRVPLQPSE